MINNSLLNTNIFFNIYNLNLLNFYELEDYIWNPKMSSYLLLKKNQYYIINLQKTFKLLKLAENIVEKVINNEGKILFVGTNNAFKNLIEYYALLTNNYYINTHWIGGLLSNWITIQKQIYLLNNINKNKKSKKLELLYTGIKNMKKLPNLIIFFDQKNNISAIKECLSLGIPVISLIDINSNPNIMPYPVPINNNSFLITNFILNIFCKKIFNKIKID